MGSLGFKGTFLAFIISGILAGLLPQLAVGQNCSCGSRECCSQYVYCGITSDYCGTGCQNGPCTGSNGVSVAEIVTDAFFNGIADQASSNCPGKGFYTRSAFLDAIGSFSAFGTTGSEDDSKREIAAFFAQANSLTERFCFVEAINQITNCDNTTQYPCVSGEKYYGRGPLQLATNANYAQAGVRVGFDGLNNPEILAKDSVVSFKASMWFWMTYIHANITSGQDFGATTRALAGKCDETVDERTPIQLYETYCNQLGVDPGPNLSCNLIIPPRSVKILVCSLN